MAISSIQVGMNGRFFPNNWRPAAEEIAFAQNVGFHAMQFAIRDEPLTPQKLGDSYEATAERLQHAGIIPVMEIVMAVDHKGTDARGHRPLAVLEEQLPAIQGIGIYAAHWHFVPAIQMDQSEFRRLEEQLRPDLLAGVALAEATGFKLGIEHNEPEIGLFGPAEACAAALDTVPGLHFVWDLNHTVPHALEDFLSLTPRMSMLHVSDTPLPTVNYHLPIGLGTLNFAHYFGELMRRGFQGPAILEIGGLPKSGGYGRDTDVALTASWQQLTSILATISPSDG